MSSCLTGDRSISGGPEDNQPPHLEKAEKNRNKIILSFDENITLTNTSDIVSNIYPKPDIQFNRNKITIKLENENNAKQIIYFRNSILDLNEGIVLPDFIYADNVGADTFSLKGKIGYLFENNSAFDNTYVALYFDKIILENQSDIYNYNFTKTNKDGYFNLQYIPQYEGAQIIAFKDVNNNNMLDTSDYAMLSSPLYSNNKKDSVFYISYMSNNFLRKENELSIYKNINQYKLNYFNPTKEKINKDTVYDFSQTDSIVLSQTKNLVSGQKLYQINNKKSTIVLDTQFFKSTGNKEWLIKPIKKDTTLAITNNLGDTLYTYNLLSDMRKSSIKFKIPATNEQNLRGILFNDDFHKKLDFKLKDTLNLFQGSYFFILYDDANTNGFYDAADAKNGKTGEKVVYNLKVIDIGAAMDVEIVLD